MNGSGRVSRGPWLEGAAREGAPGEGAPGEGAAGEGAAARMPPDASIVAAQIGRPPRDPWRVAVRCTHGYPTVVASPSRLSDGAVFPTLYWLSCPYLAQAAAAAESAGVLADWDRRAATDEDLVARLEAADAALRAQRAIESTGDDACQNVGVAGQVSATAAKCLHARIALALVGIDDPIGRDLLDGTGIICPDRRCDTLGQKGSEEG